MPAVADYTHFYYIGTTPPDGTTTYSAGQGTANTLTDSEDGGDDNVTAVGDEVIWSESGLTVEIFGTTANGEPVVIVYGGATTYYVLSNDGSQTGNIGFDGASPYMYCFAAGTQISTPSGDKTVEMLSIGDMVLTQTGASVPVKWVGYQTVRKLFSGAKMQPVRIGAGALGDGLPHSDLTVTADHGMIIDGLVINASALVNGDTIDFVPLSELPDQVTYYHVETDAHDVILANGAPAETFMDASGRSAFDNSQEYIDLYGVERIIPEMDMPRISSRRLVPDAIKTRLGIKDEEIKGDLFLSA
ncbi:MAG: Hint domain-containing protein [Sulfitobacter sp.]